MEYFGAWGTLIHEKNLKSKISCQTPFNDDADAMKMCPRRKVIGRYAPWTMRPFEYAPLTRRVPDQYNTAEVPDAQQAAARTGKRGGATPVTDTDTATSDAAGSHTTAAAAAEAPVTGTEEAEVPGVTLAEVDAARSAARAATMPARVDTGTRRSPTHAGRTDANRTDANLNNNIDSGSIVFIKKKNCVPNFL
jgi:hypothetical protein